MRTWMASVLATVLALTAGVTVASAAFGRAMTGAAAPPRYIPFATVKKAVFAHLTGQKPGETYSQLRTKDFTDLRIEDKNFGSFHLFVTARGVRIQRFLVGAGPIQVRFPARRRIIVASKVYEHGSLGKECKLVELYGRNVGLAYTADASAGGCPAKNPPARFRQLDRILRSLPGA
jgi:hypothetical protein